MESESVGARHGLLSDRARSVPGLAGAGSRREPRIRRIEEWSGGGRNAAAYSSAKALEIHLARCLAEEGGSASIRVNTVNPDAVLQGSSIWSSAWREERALTYGIAPDQLEEHYRARTTLKVNILPEDVAETVLSFASPRSAKSTGNILNVDGGVVAAYTR